MPLESGQYYITSADGGSPIGRKPMEDPNRVPKGIYKLPEGTQSVVSTISRTPRMARASPKLLTLVATVLRSLPVCFVTQWDVEKLDNGHYKLKNGGDIVGGIAMHLFAFPVPDPTATTEWIFGLTLNYIDQEGYYAYALRPRLDSESPPLR